MKTTQNKMITMLATLAVLTVGIKSSVGQQLAAPTVSSTNYVELFRQAVQKAQPATGRVRIPVPERQIRILYNDLLKKGVRLSLRETGAAADVLSAFMRENPSNPMLKIARGVEQRPSFHGNVTEFVEAGKRRMVLTKNIQSQTWDLTELRARPRNAQLKVYGDPSNIFKKGNPTLAKLNAAAGKMGGRRAHLIMPQDAIDIAMKRGLLRRHGQFYAPISGEKVTVLPLKSFRSATESSRYTASGQRALEKLREARYPLYTPRQSPTAYRPAARFQTGRNAVKTSKLVRASIPKSSAAVILSPKEVNLFSKMVKSPGFGAGVATFAIDSGISTWRYLDGDINKSELAEEIQDASIKAAAVGLAVQAVYILSATPGGLVVVGVAIVTYVVADAVVTYFREKHSGRYLKVEDLRGIASNEFLDNLQPTIEDALKSKSQRRTIAD